MGTIYDNTKEEGQVYKNVYYDSETRRYFFWDGKERREVVSQEAYLMIYLLEVLLNGKT